jgi:REP element-mobilizing transposase RayT/AraC-like DNA-binding protein
MPRKLRIEYPGAMYHVMSRGDRRERIFLDDVDRHDFIKTLAEACQKTGWQVHSYCLMPNHYHLVLETPEPNLVAGMAWLQSSYTIRLNHRHQLFGHVFSGRYKAQLVEGSGNGYLRTACDYVHLNPVRAGMLPPQERLLSYPWSSFGAYLAAPEHRPSWVRVDRLLGEHGIQEDNSAGRGQFEQWMERRRGEETDPEALKALRRGWCLGGERFRRELLLRMEGRLGEHHAGELHRASAEAKAERIIAEELGRQGWQEADLLTRRRGDPVKLELAARLRRETTLSIKAIAARVGLGSSKAANRSLHNHMRGVAPGGAETDAGQEQLKT